MPAPHVGRPLKRLEDPKLITGRDAYVNDVRLEGALTMAVVRSPHAHAEIESIDVSATRRITGVVAVFTGPDLPELGVVQSPLPDAAFDWVNRQGNHVLALDRVRYVGEPVAVVVAEGPTAAADAAEAVLVRYEQPAVVDPEAALEPSPWPRSASPTSTCR
jgi:aerobic carbon-monoxide dehydrogenase large subunit